MAAPLAALAVLSSSGQAEGDDRRPAATPGEAGLVDAALAVPSLGLDLRYSTSNNLLARPLYDSGRCWLLPQVAAALGDAQALLRRQGLRLLVWDCFRPRRVQRLLWQRAPTPGLVADPRRGSNHNRGAAVDVGLIAVDGTPVALPTDFDDLGPRAGCAATAGVSDAAQSNRQKLQAAMRTAGFRTIRREWWHFDWRGALALPVIDAEL